MVEFEQYALFDVRKEILEFVHGTAGQYSCYD